MAGTRGFSLIPLKMSGMAMSMIDESIVAISTPNVTLNSATHLYPSPGAAPPLGVPAEAFVVEFVKDRLNLSLFSFAKYFTRATSPTTSSQSEDRRTHRGQMDGPSRSGSSPPGSPR